MRRLTQSCAIDLMSIDISIPADRLSETLQRVKQTALIGPPSAEVYA
ncbi:MAG TPA: hypothetical protein VKZ53_04745 [Candidatus Angelobacter sp.]|nr:hypothetical protein [Candidatus Angelobacter sp.]